MTDLSHISIEELLFDRQEAFNDLAAVAIAQLAGLETYSGKSIADRAEKNLIIIEKIRAECEKRGFDPAIYDGH